MTNSSPLSAAALAERLIQAAVDYEQGRCSSRELSKTRTAVEAAITAPAQPVAHSSAGIGDVRQKAEDAIRTFCQSLGAGSVSISSDGIERIYYAGINLKALSVAVALAALNEPQTAAWQPIETAPKDEVLLYFPAKVVGAYSQSTLPEMRKIGRVSDFPNRIPTHWQPITASPLPRPHGGGK